MSDPTWVVIGPGPTAGGRSDLGAARAARAGAGGEPDRPAGAAGAARRPCPGSRTIWALVLPARAVIGYRDLPIEQHGVEWLSADVESVHPALDGTSASILRRDRREGARPITSGAKPTRRSERLLDVHAKHEPALFRALLAAAGYWQLARIGLLRLMKLGSYFRRRAAACRGAGSRARGGAARLYQGWRCTQILGPSDPLGGATGYVLTFSAGTVGYPVPRGGAQRITDALVTLLEKWGGRRLGARVERVIVRGGRAAAVRVAGDDEIPATRAIVADTAPGALLLDLVGREHLPGLGAACRGEVQARAGHVQGRLCARARRGAIPRRRRARPRTSARASRIWRGSRQRCGSGRLPQKPYLVAGQQSLFDSTRAPEGCHTLYVYTHVPGRIDGG